MLTLISPESQVPKVPKDHPLRRIKGMAEQQLKRLSPVFDQMYSKMGRPSITPERILKASLLNALYSVQSEREFCEQLDYNLPFRWFLDMNMIEANIAATVFTKNRERLMAHKVGRLFFDAVVRQAQEADLMSNDHFTADGTLIEESQGRMVRRTSIRIFFTTRHLLQPSSILPSFSSISSMGFIYETRNLAFHGNLGFPLKLPPYILLDSTLYQ